MATTGGTLTWVPLTVTVPLTARHQPLLHVPPVLEPPMLIPAVLIFRSKLTLALLASVTAKLPALKMLHATAR